MVIVTKSTVCGFCVSWHTLRQGETGSDNSRHLQLNSGICHGYFLAFAGSCCWLPEACCRKPVVAGSLSLPQFELAVSPFYMQLPCFVGAMASGAQSSSLSFKYVIIKCKQVYAILSVTFVLVLVQWKGATPTVIYVGVENTGKDRQRDRGRQLEMG